MNQFAYVGPGIAEGTIKEAMLHFFYDGVSPWISECGYSWLEDEDVVAKKFLYLCYTIHKALKGGYDLKAPMPNHRDYDEDRDTFDYFVDSRCLVELLDAWEFRNEIVGTRFDHLIKEFCYIWIDVSSGRPGTFTQKILTAEEEEYSDEEIVAVDIWSKKRWDLY
jgi:hypothetical protein